MSKRKKSFLLHIDSLEILEDLSDEQAGKLFKAIYSHQIECDLVLDQITKMVFLPFRNQFERDNEKYTKTCERRAIAGSKGGKQKVANASNCKQDLANVADNKNKNKNKTNNKSDNNKEVINKVSQSLDYSSWPSLPDDQVLKDWLSMRKRLKANVTQTVINRLAKQLTIANQHGYSVDECLSECQVRNWRGFEYEWIAKSKKPGIHDISQMNYESGEL